MSAHSQAIASTKTSKNPSTDDSGHSALVKQAISVTLTPFAKEAVRRFTLPNSTPVPTTSGDNPSHTFQFSTNASKSSNPNARCRTATPQASVARELSRNTISSKVYKAAMTPEVTLTAIGGKEGTMALLQSRVPPSRDDRSKRKAGFWGEDETAAAD